MTVLSLPENLLREAGLTEREAYLELVCRLYEAGRISLASAAKYAGLDRAEMEDALMERSIPIYRVTSDSFAQDLKTLERLKP